MFVPVVNQNQEPLMPTTPSRAYRWIKSRKATPFWKKGVFCVRLNVKTLENKQEIALGIDPGSKREGFTVKSKAHTYLNIQTSTPWWVKDAISVRAVARNNRRKRKAPWRKSRHNRIHGGLAPSTRSRWQWKLRIRTWLCRMFPISVTVVEDVSAKSRSGKKSWNKSFSPLQVGKKWFYAQIPNLITKHGWETKQLRDELGLKKSSNKLSNDFFAHCVDSWVLANSAVGGHDVPDNVAMLYLVPMRWHRRQLHVFVPKAGIRKRYGGMRSLGFKRGSLVWHSHYGLAYIGGTYIGRLSLHSLATGARIARRVRPADCRFLAYSSWRFSA